MTIAADLLPHTITITSSVEVEDAYGNKVLTYDPEQGAIQRTAAAYVRPAPASEDVVDRDAVTSVWQVHTNDMSITALDQVVYDGTAYAVDGKPNTWLTDPRGRPGHTKLLLKRVDG